MTVQDTSGEKGTLRSEEQRLTADREMKVPAGTGRSVYTDKRSEFFGLAVRINSEEEAAAIIDSVRKEHPGARHVCYAYRLAGGGVRRYSDDGEPQGSAGRPILEVLDRNAADMALIVVTRYFGGILLGTGGLVRAYSSAASAALEDAGLVTLIPFSTLRAVFEYADWSRAELPLRRCGAVVRRAEYGSGVTVLLSVPEAEAERVSALITEMTAGRSRAEITGWELLPRQP